MSYIPCAWRTHFPVRGYTLDLEGFTAGDIARFNVRVQKLEEWRECETANEVYCQTNYAKYHRRGHKKRGSK